MTSDLVLLPGLICDERLWRDVVAGLDVRAHIADLTEDDSMAAMAARVLVSAPARFALAGLSMGGYVAFEIMRQAPERVSHLALSTPRQGPMTTPARKRGARASPWSERASSSVSRAGCWAA